MTASNGTTSLQHRQAHLSTPMLTTLNTAVYAQAHRWAPTAERTASDRRREEAYRATDAATHLHLVWNRVSGSAFRHVHVGRRPDPAAVTNLARRRAHPAPDREQAAHPVGRRAHAGLFCAGGSVQRRTDTADQACRGRALGHPVAHSAPGGGGTVSGRFVRPLHGAGSRRVPARPTFTGAEPGPRR